jgi:hypothetical protein
MIHAILFRSRLGGWLLALLEEWAGLAVVEADSLAMQRVGPAVAGNLTPGLNQTQGGNLMSEKIVSRPYLLDKALSRGFAFLVAPSPTNRSVYVTVYTPDNRPFTTVNGLLPSALATVQKAAETACEVRPPEAQ